jgi:hypothetical protein
MGAMVECGVCGKKHESQNFKTCDKCGVTGCTWCMSNGSGGVTTCQQCKRGKARPAK